MGVRYEANVKSLQLDFLVIGLKKLEIAVLSSITSGYYETAY